MPPRKDASFMEVDSDSDISIPDDIEAPRRAKGKGKAKAGGKRKAEHVAKNKDVCFEHLPESSF